MADNHPSMPGVVFNIRHLLQQTKAKTDLWAHELSRRTRTVIPVTRAREIITNQGEPPNRRELDLIAEAFSRETEEISQGCLYSDGPDALRKSNLLFLLNTLPHGGRKILAAKLGIRQATITRWVSENKIPEKKNIEGLLKHLGLDPDLDLTVEPLFLSLQPVGGFLQRQWLIDRLEVMPEEKITLLFPALQRIFRQDEHN